MHDKSNIAKPVLILVRAAGLVSLAGGAYITVKADRWLHAAYPVKPGPGTHLEYATRLTHALGQNMRLQAEDMRQKKQLELDSAWD